MAAPCRIFARQLSQTAFRAAPTLAGHRSLPRAQYGGRHTVAAVSGDGVGPELLAHVKEVFRHAGIPIDFEDIKLDVSVTDDAELDYALLAIKRNGVALKGNIRTRIDTPSAIKSRNVELRAELNLFANVVWCKSIPGIATRHNDIDVVIIRENTEGEYRQLEHENVDGVVESLKIITEEKSRRIAEYAFDFAHRYGRKKVTAVHKANIMKLGDGLFLECCRKVSEKYPDIEFEGMIVDNCSMQMVSRPQQFDVMVLPNLYGNIIANIAAGLVGGAGVVSGANIGGNFAVFETGTRNTGGAISGKNIANPAGMLLASGEMLEHIGLLEEGELIKNSVYKVLSEDRIHTPDIGGTATTSDMVQAVIRRVHEATRF